MICRPAGHVGNEEGSLKMVSMGTALSEEEVLVPREFPMTNNNLHTTMKESLTWLQPIYTLIKIRNKWLISIFQASRLKTKFTHN